ncbi:MAG TPA: M20/M25/M40 family metallo-hydrolase [Candidatus Acidoferrum sp.]|nr:M20/M25/M40 family metallo-hydrolase [Candidatus Acidoferrum sp.]
MLEEGCTHRPLCVRNTTLSLFLCAAVLLVSGIATAQERTDLDAAKRIRDAALNHSQIMDTIGYLADVIGPRLTGSPNLKRAEEYARDKLREWGLANAHLEAWGPFGRGWSIESFTANMVSSGFSPLIAYPKAWSPGTNGTIRGEVVFFDVKTASDLDKYKGKLKGKIVLFSPARHVDPLFEPPAQRRTDEELLRLANAQPSDQPQPFQFTPEQRASEDLNYAKWQLIQNEGAAVVLQPSVRDAGTVYVTSASVPYPPDVPFPKRAQAWDLSKPMVIPQISVAAEQYNRIVRLVARGISVELEVNIAVRFYDDDPTGYNVIGEIPGTDLKDEIVMVGGSIDSWHAGTGATDNAVGAATALEVIRILQSLGLKPRRTIRVGLWSAEEQGSLGSRAYVAAHLGRKINPSDGQSGVTRFEFKPEYEKFDAYFNFDYGTGRIRGLYMQGNEAARPIFRELLDPYRDLGASTLSMADIGATDHIPFDEVGLPAFQWIRDYMEGDNTRAPHTNMDTYDHVLEDDLKQSAAVAASLIYELAVRDERIPHKPRHPH